MDDLFEIYRYLAINRLRTNDHYNRAFDMLNAYVDIERELAYFAKKIRSTGGLTPSEAEKLTVRILSAFEGNVVRYYGSALPAAIEFVRQYFSLDDFDHLIEACQEEKAGWSAKKIT